MYAPEGESALGNLKFIVMQIAFVLNVRLTASDVLAFRSKVCLVLHA
jgi:hypothetical protein